MYQRRVSEKVPGPSTFATFCTGTYLPQAWFLITQYRSTNWVLHLVVIINQINQPISFLLTHTVLFNAGTFVFYSPSIKHFYISPTQHSMLQLKPLYHLVITYFEKRIIIRWLHTFSFRSESSNISLIILFIKVQCGLQLPDRHNRGGSRLHERGFLWQGLFIDLQILLFQVFKN